jgi:O-antigen ligase
MGVRTPFRRRDEASTVATLAAVSSLATAPDRAAPGGPRAARNAAARVVRARPNEASALALAAGLVLIVFVTTGGTNLAPNTWTQIVLTLLGAAAAISLVIFGAPGRRFGVPAFVLFAALAALTALSIAWSVQPDASWLEANRTLSYLAVFGGGMALARLFPERWPGLLGSIALLSTVICGYALLVKVFPGTFAPQETLGRLRAPFDYWNATGLMAALGLAPCLWAGARADKGRWSRGLAAPAIAILVTTLVLSYSRSAVLAAVVAVALWFAVVPLRLRGAAVLAVGLAGAALLSAWALHTHALTHDGITLSSRVTAGHGFGIVLVLVLLATAAGGFAVAFALDRTVLPADMRRRIGIALVTLVALLPFAGAAALAASSRGFGGEVSHIWTSLTNTREVVRDNPGRLVSLESSRARDWSQGWHVFTHAPVKGVGAAGFATAHLRYYRVPLPVDHAHSYVVQTMADLGLVGLAISLALLVAWCVATARAVGLRPRPGPGHDRAPEATVERLGLLTLLCVVVAFGVHSSIDWTWFIPGTAIPALLCAGWLAGRGELERPVGRRATTRPLSARPGVALAGTALTAVALLAAWAIWQPLRSSDAFGAAVDAASRGNTSAAFARARTAAARNPVDVQPLWLLSSLYSRIGAAHAAHGELVKAISLQPENPDTWLQLGSYDLSHGQPHKAIGVLRHALKLNIGSTEIAADLQAAIVESKRTRAK